MCRFIDLILYIFSEIMNVKIPKRSLSNMEILFLIQWHFFPFIFCYFLVLKSFCCFIDLTLYILLTHSNGKMSRVMLLNMEILFLIQRHCVFTFVFCYFLVIVIVSPHWSDYIFLAQTNRKMSNLLLLNMDILFLIQRHCFFTFDFCYFLVVESLFRFIDLNLYIFSGY